MLKGIKEKLYEIGPVVFEGTPVLFAYLYGSYARGLTHPFSDLDIAVFAKDLDMEASLDLELSLALRIDEMLDHLVQSEVRLLNHMPLVVKGTILSEGELIYSRGEGERVEFESRVRMAYFDFLPTLRNYRESYREKLLSVSDSG